MSVPARFVNTSFVPPGGMWFFQLGDDRVTSPVYELAVKRVGELLALRGVDKNPAQALAEFMCPHMPSWFCAGEVGHSPVITVKDACEKAWPYFGKKVLPVDIISRRLEVCQSCAKHRRDFCLHCSGLDTWVSDGFRNARPVLPADDASGCCTCAGTMEAVIASVAYGEQDSVWEGVPETCWRNQR